MVRNAHFGEGINLPQLIRMFPDDATAEQWFTEQRWPEGPYCPHCGSTNVLSGAAHATMPYRCRAKGCRKRFSVRTGTCMEASNLGFQTWAVAVYLTTAGLKGVSSIKLHRILDITQKSAWHLAMRLRKALEDSGEKMKPAEAEADETYIGGLGKNMHADKKLRAGRGGVGKSIVAAVKDRESGMVVAPVGPDTKTEILQGFVEQHTTDKVTVYTDEYLSYVGREEPDGRTCGAVCHSVGRYVREQAHNNGVESFWAQVERGHMGGFHKFSKKHPQRYVDVFAGRHNALDRDTIDQMCGIVARMVNKRLTYRALIADNGLDSGARS